MGSSQPPTYSCYSNGLMDAHLTHNPGLYSPASAPNLTALTNRNANGQGHQASKIDFVFISGNLIARLSDCAIVPTIPDVVPLGLSYHLSIVTELEWPSLFNSPPPNHDPLAGLTGSALPTRPNVRALTPALGRLIAEQVESPLSSAARAPRGPFIYQNIQPV
jgi:hypothetical protein